ARLTFLLSLGAVGVALVASDDAARSLLLGVLAILVVVVAGVVGDGSRAGREGGRSRSSMRIGLSPCISSAGMSASLRGPVCGGAFCLESSPCFCLGG